MGDGDTWLNAAIGAFVTIVTSFTGVAPIIGGAVAGYLNKRDGAKAGALSGAIALVPLLLLFVLAGSLVAFLPVVHGGMGPGMGMAGAIGGAFVLVAFTFMLVYSVGLGALGGYLGEYLVDEDVLS